LLLAFISVAISAAAASPGATTGSLLLDTASLPVPAVLPADPIRCGRASVDHHIGT
jgi:hypothetical protein